MALNSFYYFGQTNYHLAIVSLVENIALKKGLKVRILCASEQVSEIDTVLWTKKQLSFIPHAVEGNNLFATPVFISSEEQSKEFGHDIIISVLPKMLSVEHKRAIYLVNNESLNAFKNLFVELKGRGQQCKLHVLEQNKWNTYEEFSNVA